MPASKSSMFFTLYVKNADASARFYSCLAPQFTVLADFAIGSGERYVDLGLSNDESVALRLVQLRGVSSARLAFLQKKHTAAITIRVADVLSEVDRLDKLGYEARDVQIERGCEFAVYTDPDGNTVQLLLESLP